MSYTATPSHWRFTISSHINASRHIKLLSIEPREIQMHCVLRLWTNVLSLTSPGRSPYRHGVTDIVHLFQSTRVIITHIITHHAIFHPSITRNLHTTASSQRSSNLAGGRQSPACQPPPLILLACFDESQTTRPWSVPSPHSPKQRRCLHDPLGESIGLHTTRVTTEGLDQQSQCHCFSGAVVGNDAPSLWSDLPCRSDPLWPELTWPGVGGPHRLLEGGSMPSPAITIHGQTLSVH